MVVAVVMVIYCGGGVWCAPEVISCKVGLLDGREMDQRYMYLLYLT